MMLSNGPRFPCGVLNSSLMSSCWIISSALEACLGRVVDRSCGAGHVHVLPPCGQSRWLITVITVVLLALANPVPVDSQSSENRTQLDTQIYQQAFLTLRQQSRILTGTVYNASLPSNMTLQNVDTVQVVRLRTHSLKIRGYKFNEISMPVGVTVVQNIRSVVLVYRKFRQYQFYNATAGNTFVSPVVGILVYDANDISNTTNPRSELTMIANQLGSSIVVQLEPTKDSEDNVKCAMYNNTGPVPQNGTTTGSLKNFTSSNSCTWTMLGDYSLVGPKPKGKSNTWKIALGAALGGVALALLLVAAALLALRYRNRARFKRMEHKADEGETLQDAKVGSSRAPAAGGTRTKGKLEKSLS